MPFLILLLVLGSSAPVLHVSVATSVSPSPDKAGNTLLFVDVVPMPKIHVYAPGANDYVPITIKLVATPGVAAGKVTYPKSELLFFAPLKEIVPVFQKPFRLVQEIKLEASRSKPVTVTGTVEYQACDDHICFPRETIPVSWTIPAGKAGQ